MRKQVQFLSLLKIFPQLYEQIKKFSLCASWMENSAEMYLLPVPLI